MSEVPVLVVDVGSASLKSGYSGEDAPATIIPSVAQKCANGLEVNTDAMTCISGRNNNFYVGT